MATEINRMNIVQRATFKTVPTDSTVNMPLTGRDGLLSMDYMGAAEYEWGAVPNSFTRIMVDFSKYELFDLSIEKSHLRPIVNCNGVPLQVFCRKDQLDDVWRNLLNFIDGNDPTKVVTYHLKESISFAQRGVYGFKSAWGGYRRDNFWWDLRNDFMFFFGVNDRRRAFLNSITFDYTDWWSKLDPAVMNDRIEKAKRRW